MRRPIFFYSRRRVRINSLNFYAFLDSSHYIDLDTESDKQEFYTRAQGKVWVTETNALGVSFSYLYRLSSDADYAVENEPIPEYKNEEYIVTPSWEKKFRDDLSVKIETVSLQSVSNDLSSEYISDSILLGLIWLF